MKLKRFGFTAIMAGVVVALCSCQTETTDNFFQIDQAQYKTTFNQVRTSSMYKCEANQSGAVKILVVPVDFVGYSADDLPAGRVGTREQIGNVIFGDSPSENPNTEVQWESLKSFYDKSSYGKCKMSGYVGDWWHVDQTPTDFKNGASVQGLVSSVSAYYSSGYVAGFDPTEYDANDDGYIDLTILVYSCKQKVLGNSDDVFWAYTTQTSARADRTSPKVSRYIWMSQNFMFENGYWDGDTHNEWSNQQIANREAKLDAHTFIHETGHGLGLDDYYTYDDGDVEVMGMLDMMDMNVGDHNAYSKAVYGWTSPYVVEGRSTITINSFQKTGDSIIVPIRSKNWKENSYTLMDEYLIVEYDTVENLVQFDSLHKYAGSYPQWFTTDGVRVMHVDSRIGVFSHSTGNFIGYTQKTTIANTDNYIFLAHDNTLSRTVNGNRLLQLLGSDGNAMRGQATNATLFKQGSTFGFDTYKNFKMNDGSDLGFKFEITSIANGSCTIDFYVA